MGGIGLKGLNIGNPGEPLEEEGFQTHGAGVHASAAADAVGFLSAAGLSLREKEEGAGTLYRCGVKVGNGAAHHGTTAYHLNGIGGDTTQIIKDIAERSTYAHQEVGLVGEALTGYGHGVVHNGLVLLDCIVHGKGGCHVLDNGANGDRQGA